MTLRNQAHPGGDDRDADSAARATETNAQDDDAAGPVVPLNYGWGDDRFFAASRRVAGPQPARRHAP